MSSRLFILFVLISIFILVLRENLRERPDRLYQTASGQVEMCLGCHQKENPDPAHGRNVMGCSVCHGGNAFATDNDSAHKGMIKNPGDLRFIEKSCAIEGCHGADAHRVKNSLMATNRGILATLLYYWGEAKDQNGDYSVEKLLKSGETSLALDYFRKLCGTCHLWKQRDDVPGFLGEKGGGCTACHNIKGETHPQIIRKVPTENCLRCHNRSGRIGISYTGAYESEGYGTPYTKGGFSEQRLPGERFSLSLEPDIHHRQGMACIDCHTRNEIMGDGNNYAHYEEQLEIKCITCHSPAPGRTRKNNLLTNVSREEEKAGGGKYVLTGKLDGKIHPLKPPKPGTCDYAGHKRLSCESCHSTWVPQCYGCHVKRDMRDTHLDKLTLKETKGWWEEGRSYIRYEKPMLAMWKEQVVVITPGCQDIVTLMTDTGQVESQFNSFTMAAINPHTTQAKGRSCPDCHASTKTVGLGEGTAWRKNGEWFFTPVDQGVQTGIGPSPPLDGFVTIDGKQLQKSSRPDLRPFNREELLRILRVGQCLGCHKDYSDPAFAAGFKDACPVFTE